MKVDARKERETSERIQDSKFSLVIPTLARNFKFLEECLDSINNSHLKPSEIILVVPNKSDFIDKFSKLRFDSMPIRIIEGNRNGIGQARLIGSASAKFEYISFVDDDDKVHSEFFLRLMRALQSDKKIAAVGCWLQSFGFASHIVPQFDNLTYIGLINCSPSAGILMWRRKELMLLGGHDPNFKNGYEDFDLTVRALAAKKIIRVIDLPIYYYRRHTRSTTMNYTEQLEQDYRTKIMSKTLNSNPEFSMMISQLLFSNSGQIKDENPFYWKAPQQSPQFLKHRLLLSVYHKFPLPLRRRIYKFVKDL
jgi:GT2 family glycosyltransferase